MGSKEGLKLVLNKFGSSKASAQLKVLLAIVVFSIASALLMSAIYAENPQEIPEQGKYAEDKQIIENIIETPKEDIILKPMAGTCGGTTACTCGDSLTSSRTLNSSDTLTGCTGNGLNIGASDIVLDCAGYTITSNNSTGHGVYIGYGLSNITIKNCTISAFNNSGIRTFGIFTLLNATGGSSNVTVMDCTFYNNYNGIGGSNAGNAYNWSILNNNFINGTGTYGYGIFLSGKGHTIQGNIIKNQLGWGIRIDNSGNNVIRDNVINNTISFDGIFLVGGIATGTDLIQNNSIAYSGNYGININSDHTIPIMIVDNNITNNAYEGIKLSSVTSKLVYHNNIENNGAGASNRQVSASGAIELSNGTSGNYWGHNACPVFTPGNNSNAVNVADNYAYNTSSGWLTTAPADCPIVCGDIITQSKTLTANLTNCAANGLNIVADNVVLDCAGHKIGGDYSGNGDGINTTAVSNLVIKNCTIYGFNGTNRAGINIGGGNNTKIVDNVLYNNHYGIVRNGNPYYSDYNISNNLIQNTTLNSGIYVTNISGLNAYNNKIYNTGFAYGIYTVFTNGTISGNIINNTYTSALSMSYFSGIITNNTLTYASYIWGGVGLELHSDYPVNITNNTITNNVYYGLYFDTSYDNSNKLVYHNNVYNNSPYQVYSLDTMALSYNNSGNYWGHDSCPIFTSGVDSGTTYSITDSYAYNTSNGWITSTPPQCFFITSFVDNVSQTYSNIGIYGSIAAPYPIPLYVNVSNATGAAGVNLSHGGVCLGLSNPQPLPYNGINFNITCYVNKTKLQGLGAEYNLTAIAYQLSSPTTKSEANYTLYSDFVSPNILGLGVTNPDIFFSPYDSIVNVYANVTDNNPPTVTANFSNITGGAACTNVAMPFNATSGFYEGSCDIGSYITVTNFTSKQIIVVAIDDFNNFDIDGTGIAVHNYGVPAFNKGPCLMLGSGSTNLSTELDFAHVNFTFDIKVNVSCYMNTNSLPDNWRDGANIEIHNVNLSNQSTTQKLSNLSSNIDVIITGPNSFGDSRIYINSNYFRELNKSATIKFFGLPFSEQPNIIADSGAAGFNASSVTWDNNGYQADLGVVTGNLTFDVYGFTGYNASDNVVPTVAMNAPASGSVTNSHTVTLSATVNGTGSPVSRVMGLVNGVTKFNYNKTQILSNCENQTIGWDVVTCNYTATSVADGNNSFTSIGYDFGGKSPGRNATNLVYFTVDATAPIVNLTTPINNSWTKADSLNFTFKVTDNLATIMNCTLNIHSMPTVSYPILNVANNTNKIYTVNLSGFAENTHTWWVNCSDAINQGNSNLNTFNKDTITPSAEIILPLNNTKFNNQYVNFSVNVSDANLLQLKMIEDNMIVQTVNLTSSGIVNVTLDIGPGTHIMKANVTDKAGNYNLTDNITIMMDTVPPVISEIYVNDITNDSETIHATTNEVATCFVQLGVNISYGFDTGTSTGMGWHNHSLSGVTSAGTLYHYRWNCTDGFNNTAVSSDYTFTTVAVETQSIPNYTVTNVTLNITENGVNKTVAQFEIYSNESVNATITLTPTGSNPTNATLGVPGLGTYYIIEASGLNSSNIKWVVIKVYYNESDIPSGVDESALSLYWFNPATNTWEAITPGGVDTVNNYVWANTTHFSVYTMGGETTTEEQQQGGGGLGGNAPTGNTTAWTGQILEQAMIVGDTITFKLDGTDHSIKLTSLGATYAFLQISSDPILVTINVGETKLIDVDRDGTNDISIKLDRVEAGKAYFTFTKLAAVPPITGVTTAPTVEQPAAPGQPAVTGQPTVTEQATTTAPDNTAMTMLFTALIVVAVIAAIVVFTKRSSK